MSTAPPSYAPVQPRRSKAKVIGAIIVVVILFGALGTYFFILAPKISIVDWSHADLPNLAGEYVFNITVKNSGMLGGSATIVCEFTYFNGTANRTFSGSKVVDLSGGEQAQYDVPVPLPALDAILSLISSSKSWAVHLA